MSDDRSKKTSAKKEPQGLAGDFFIEPQERDPMRAAARDARPQLPKRFYEKVSVEPVEGGFAILLDGKSVRTPARRPLLAPTKTLAQALAEEWSRQGERIDPATMPLTRLLNSAIDGVADRLAEVEAEVVKYAASDLVCYRAAEPLTLAREQAAKWDPLVTFAREKLDARFTLAEGVMYVPQSPQAISAIVKAVRHYVGAGAGSPFRLAALHAMTTLTGSCVIALAVALGDVSVDAAWAAANVDEDFEIAAWGADQEALARREARFAEMRAAALLSRAFAQ